MEKFGADVEIIDGPVGAAATHKLLRSVFYKGLATGPRGHRVGGTERLVALMANNDAYN